MHFAQNCVHALPFGKQLPVVISKYSTNDTTSDSTSDMFLCTPKFVPTTWLRFIKGENVFKEIKQSKRKRFQTEEKFQSW